MDAVPHHRGRCGYQNPQQWDGADHHRSTRQRGGRSAGQTRRCSRPRTTAPIAAAMELMRQLCRWIGQATAIAGEFAAPDGAVWRDAKPADRRTRAARSEGRQAKPASAAAAPVVPPRQRWASAAQASTVIEASLRHDTHRIVITGSVTWCDRCGAYAEIRGRGLARPCRGAIAGGNRVGRPLRSVQARLRALRAGRHPTSGISLEVARPARLNDHALPCHDRERSRSRRRASACRMLIGAISGAEPTPRLDEGRPTGLGADTLQRSRRVAAPSARRAAFCQLLIGGQCGRCSLVRSRVDGQSLQLHS